MTIASNPFVAQQRATAISSAVSSLAESTDVTADEKTTVAGNTNAKAAIKSAQSAATTISSAIESAATNLQSVAHDFEALDQDISRTMTLVPPPPLLGGRK